MLLRPRFFQVTRRQFACWIRGSTTSCCEKAVRETRPDFSVLGKNDLHAFQVSKRGGELFCKHAGNRVKISGKATLYMEGTITVCRP